MTVEAREGCIVPLPQFSLHALSFVGRRGRKRKAVAPVAPSDLPSLLSSSNQAGQVQSREEMEKVFLPLSSPASNWPVNLKDKMGHIWQSNIEATLMYNHPTQRHCCGHVWWNRYSESIHIMLLKCILLCFRSLSLRAFRRLLSCKPQHGLRVKVFFSHPMNGALKSTRQWC